MVDASNAEQVGVYIGSGIGGLRHHRARARRAHEGGPRRVSPFFIPSAIVNLASGWVSIRTGAKGPNSATCTACTTSAHAVGDSFRLIQRGDADAMIAGGSEAAITPLGVGGFAAMRALSHAQRGARPGLPSLRQGPRRLRDRRGGGDRHPRGAGAGEGARGADLLRGRGLRDVLRRVPHLRAQRERRRRHPGHAQHAEGRRGRALGGGTTSTCTARRRPRGDVVETIAIKAVFGEHARKLAISSTKSMTGHLLGAAGGLEAGITALALRDQVLPPTINHEKPDPECDLDCVPNRSRKAELRYALTQLLRLRGDERGAPLRAPRGLGPGDDHEVTAMKIVVCVKQVPDTETRIRIAPEGNAIVEADVNWIVSPYDEFAIEEALRIKEKKGGEVVLVIALGPDRAQSALRNGLAMGADSAVHVKDPLFDATDTLGTARALAAAIKGLGPFDLVLTGQQGVGGDHSQVPGLLAELLDLPQVTVAVKIEIQDGKAIVEREIEGAHETWETSLPARHLRPEGAQRAALREPQGHHGREEEDDRGEGRGRPRPRRGRARAADAGRRPRAAPGAPGGPDDRRATPPPRSKELLRLLHEEAKVI